MQKENHGNDTGIKQNKDYIYINGKKTCEQKEKEKEWRNPGKSYGHIDKRLSTACPDAPLHQQAQPPVVVRNGLQSLPQNRRPLIMEPMHNANKKPIRNTMLTKRLRNIDTTPMKRR